MAKYESEGKEEWEVKQQKKVLQDCQQMIPDCQKRLQSAVEDLQSIVVRVDDHFAPQDIVCASAHPTCRTPCLMQDGLDAELSGTEEAKAAKEALSLAYESQQ